MNTMKNACIAAALVLASIACVAQKATCTLVFTPLNGKPPITINVTTFIKNLYKFNDPHGYWVINPHNQQHHVNIQSDAGYDNADGIFLNFNSSGNDVSFFEHPHPNNIDSNSASFFNSKYVITQPMEYDGEWLGGTRNQNKPLQVHITTFTAAEIAFTISGMAACVTKAGTDNFYGYGTVAGSGHFYREPQYDKSDVLPGCDCDPTIYATTYDEENNARTTSACENALRKRVFDAMQKTLMPLFTNMAYHGGQTATPPGQLYLRTTPGHTDVTVPRTESPVCFSDYYHNGLTGINAHKAIYVNDDQYGVWFTRMPDDANTGSQGNNYMAEQMKIASQIQALGKLLADKKITMEECTKRIKALGESKETVQANNDFKWMDMNSNLIIEVIINPNHTLESLVNAEHGSTVTATNKVPGAAFEITTSAYKDGDGEWNPNKCEIYIGKFTKPILGKSLDGRQAEVTKPIVKPGANKLGIYNVVIRMKGGKDLIDQALTTINYSALQELIAMQ